MRAFKDQYMFRLAVFDDAASTQVTAALQRSLEINRISGLPTSCYSYPTYAVATWDTSIAKPGPIVVDSEIFFR